MAKSTNGYSRFAKAASHFCGRPRVFTLAVAMIVVWVVTGPLFGFSDTWQLVINTGTTIITFLMVFLIQNTQNRDTDILHLKIDELLRVNKEAQNAMLGLELLDLKQLEALRRHYRAMGEKDVHDLAGLATTSKRKQDLNEC
ncbi:MAG: low affinity iron permease family protein [Pseudomonas sp.]|uniref:low affinity iron permease family protein n=1 Tax=Pseudomonas sp. TaxID=306 RepID=UPI00271BE992|nr:low affinity iron permease family protein [Pseudomonas sp.]MDO8405835.1 low affinity iron permease family protein [Pseudomonas sp.]